MGFISDLLGTGNQKQAPGAQNLQMQNFNNSPEYLQAQAAYQQAQQGQQGIQSGLAAQGGLSNQSNVFNQQQMLANQLGQQALGGGPNPAQAALNQNTATNTANQAALMASQRGASANPALLARMAAGQGAANQQAAIGQAATLQAQQSLAAQQALGQQQQAMQGVASNQIGNLIGNQQSLAGNALNNQNQVLNAIGNQNATQAGIQNTVQQGQNELSKGAQEFGNKVLGGALNAAGAGIGMSSGGQVENPKLAQVPKEDRFPSKVMMPPHLKMISSHYHGDHSPGFSHGGDVGSQLKSGGKVPGKAKMSGDHPENDTVHAKLSPGEVVIPKSVMESQDPVKEAAKFVSDLMKKKGSSKNHESEFKQALQRAIKERKVK